MSSQGPVLLPGNFVFAAGKDGKGYTLHANALGGIGGQTNRFAIPTISGTTIFIGTLAGITAVTIA
jgi:hypothetical protein